MSDSVTVLVVEDDGLIQVMIEEALSAGGFQTTATGSGEEAMTLLQTNTNSISSDVTDINLSGKRDGWEVAQRSREIDPPCRSSI